MKNEEVEKLGNKYFEKEEIKKVEQKAWVDSAHVMAVITNRSDIINILSNYTEMNGKAEEMIKGIEKLQTVKASFSVEYLKDILKLLTKFDKSLISIKIKLGNDQPITFEVEDENGKTTIILAPRVE